MARRLSGGRHRIPTGRGRWRRVGHLGLAAVAGAVLIVMPGAEAGIAAPVCAGGLTLDVAAHQDDDILFMTPDIQHDIDRRRCLVTTFVTAGDAGEGETYWHERELGPHAAYAFMAGVANDWTRRTDTIGGHTVVIDTLADRPEISLLYLRLPDGGNGAGFPANSNESLQKLWTGVLPSIHTVDGTGSYTKATLISTLAAIMDTFQPTVIRTLDYTGNYGDGDHGDHHTSAFAALAAHKSYTTPHQITAYMAYEIANRPVNVRYASRDHKLDIFMAYAVHDSKVCQTLRDCIGSGYQPRSFRQYTTASEVGGGQNVARLAQITSSSQNVAAKQQAVKAIDNWSAGSWVPGPWVFGGNKVDTTREWATVGGKAGSWIEARWPTPYEINKVVLYDRPNPSDNVTGGTLRFSDGSTVAVGALPADGSAKIVTFPARRVTAMRFTVGSVSASTTAVGLAELQAFTTNVAPQAVVTASSQNATASQQATRTIDGYPSGAGREWATVGGRADSWLRLTWRAPQDVDRVVLYDRPNANDQITGGRIVFDDDSTVSVPALPNNGAGQTITFPRRSITSLQLNITSVSGTTRNVGLGEIEVSKAP